MELIAVVMGCETANIRNAACKSMLDYGFANYAVVSPHVEGDASVPVKLGQEPSVRAVPGENPKLLIDKSLKNGVTTDVTLEEFVSAPILPGQTLGQMIIRSGEQILARIPLVAEAGVNRLRWRDLLVFTLRKMTMGA